MTTQPPQSAMLILAANENLLERLVLLVQNSPHGDMTTSNNISPPLPPLRARTVLLSSSAAPGLPVSLGVACPTMMNGDGSSLSPPPHYHFWMPSFKWIILMGKKGFGEHLAILQTLADLYRLSLIAMDATTADEEEGGRNKNPVRILIVKKDHSEDDERNLMEHLDIVRKEWTAEWGDQGDKLKRFGVSDAQKEHLERSKHWSNSSLVPPTCALAYFDDPNLLEAICSFFDLGPGGIQISGQREEGNEEVHLIEEEIRHLHLFTKPPALHWTNFPRDSEVQVTFKFTFPSGTIPDLVFREWARMGKSALCWDYEYEWTNGVLLRAEELVKVTITRCASSPNVVEVSGRIDTDEAAEEEEEVDGSDPSSTELSLPLQRVWPYLVRVFQAILHDVEGRRTLPFSLSLVFIGDIFFNCPDGVPRVAARSLDAIQTLSSIQRIGTVRFRIDHQHIYSLNLLQCFPNFCPVKLADFSSQHFPLPIAAKTSIGATSSSSPSDGPATGTSLLGSAMHSPIQQRRIDRSPSCTPALFVDQGNQDKVPLSPSNSNSLQICKNRSRRVSFGVIHSIPSLDANNATEPQIRPQQPSAGTRSEIENEKFRANNEEERMMKMVENVVDEMLQKAIDELTTND